MALGRSTGLLLFALSSLAGCGGAPSSAAEAPANTSAEAPATPSEPAPAAESSGAEATGETPSADTKPTEGSDEKWEGEDKAVAAGTPVARTKEETRTTAVIAETVKANRQPVRDCYDKGRKEIGDLKGTMTIKFTLDPDGKVKKAELNLQRSDIKAPAVVTCAIDALKKIKFPPSSRGMETTVDYPFDFKPDGGGGSGKKQ
jgi:TonB family protein